VDARCVDAQRGQTRADLLHERCGPAQVGVRVDLPWFGLWRSRARAQAPPEVAASTSWIPPSSSTLRLVPPGTTVWQGAGSSLPSDIGPSEYLASGRPGWVFLRNEERAAVRETATTQENGRPIRRDGPVLLVPTSSHGRIGAGGSSANASDDAGVASRCGSASEQALRRLLQSRQGRAAGVSDHNTDRRWRGDANLWRRAGASARTGRDPLSMFDAYTGVRHGFVTACVRRRSPVKRVWGSRSLPQAWKVVATDGRGQVGCDRVIERRDLLRARQRHSDAS
jgi:hypothetical protein